MQVTELATQVRKLEKQGVKNPFVFVSLPKCARFALPMPPPLKFAIHVGRFLPTSHADYVPVLLSEKGEFSTPKGKREKVGAYVF